MTTPEDLIAAYPEGFSVHETAWLSGATARQLDYWDRTDILWPSLQRASGQGNPKRRWAFPDLVVASMLAELSGMSDISVGHFRNQALSLALHLHYDTYGDWDAWLVITGPEVALFPSAEAAVHRIITDRHQILVNTFVNLGAHARRIINKEARRGQAAI